MGTAFAIIRLDLTASPAQKAHGFDKAGIRRQSSDYLSALGYRVFR